MPSQSGLSFKRMVHGIDTRWGPMPYTRSDAYPSHGIIDSSEDITGGMGFAGGPLNNFVLQAAVRMTELLRGDPGSAGLLTAVSGMLTKQGVSVFATRPPTQGFHFEDLAAEVARETREVLLVSDREGPARVASYTVLYEGDSPSRGILLCDLGEGRRCIATTRDAQLARAMTQEEFCGRSVVIGAGDVIASVSD